MPKIVKCNKEEYMTLQEIWERSVKASHSFLDDAAIREIREALIRDYFPNVKLYAITDCDYLVGFIGLQGEMIEMLFIDSDCRGHGYGTWLIEFAKSRGATKVDVNEQNPMALSFYLAKGFRITGRDDTDDAGRPYPILHLSL